ncbi:MAG: ferritin [Gammaproteobacteria bacterium]|nr:MAG: ferritin [Gammaproteobacteria bacterium]
MSSDKLHESPQALPEEIIDKHRAIASLMEELDAVDWYDQRAAVTSDAELREILLHNRNEEMEHAAMVLEWLRRRHSMIDEHLRTYLFREGNILETEEAATGKADAAQPSDRASVHEDGSLGIGSLREE